jgi:hypothetical protein
MHDTRKKLLEKVKAILAKTMDNGCTESEAMAALAKARELMATYEIDESELAESEKEAATLHKSSVMDPYNIKRNLGYTVGKFCRCEAWRERNGQRMFCGLESDVIFATWLLDTLQRYVMRALRDFQQKRAVKRIPNSNYTSASFVQGCVEVINKKLKELTPSYETNALVKAEMAKNGIVLKKARTTGREVDPNSFAKGSAAGSSARFDRPVGSGGMRMLK